MVIKRLSLVVLPLLILGLVVGGCPKISADKAPDFQLNDTDGNTISLSGYLGSPVMINFWYIGCGYCIQEMAYIQEVYVEYQNQGLIILTINITDSTASITEFMQNNDYSFTVLIDDTHATATTYNISGYPTTLFIDKDGIIRERKPGAFRNKAEIEDSLNLIMP